MSPIPRLDELFAFETAIIRSPVRPHYASICYRLQVEIASQACGAHVERPDRSYALSRKSVRDTIWFAYGAFGLWIFILLILLLWVESELFLVGAFLCSSSLIKVFITLCLFGGAPEIFFVGTTFEVVLLDCVSFCTIGRSSPHSEYVSKKIEVLM
jgi:hypothetical protein